ncbi:hypothetical protein [Sandaracinus amylolyticus]|nr:hypothetical protein [Sandaracinus amylolyticus]
MHLRTCIRDHQQPTIQHAASHRVSGSTDRDEARRAGTVHV